MASPLRTQLRAYKYDGDAAEFRDLLADTMAAMFPGWTDEKLTYNPVQAKRYCEAIVARAGLALPDEFILASLGNIRKHPVKA